MVDSYRILHAYFVNRENREYKAPWNQILNIPRVYTPDDRAVQTPNSDTPYSMVGMDLRPEPIVLTVPTIDKERYFSIQLIDLYTHNFGYIGSRATGDDGGSFLTAGPGWQGEMPPGVKQVIRSETNLGYCSMQLAGVVFQASSFNHSEGKLSTRSREAPRCTSPSACAFRGILPPHARHAWTRSTRSKDPITCIATRSAASASVCWRGRQGCRRSGRRAAPRPGASGGTRAHARRRIPCRPGLADLARAGQGEKWLNEARRLLIARDRWQVRGRPELRRGHDARRARPCRALR